MAIVVQKVIKGAERRWQVEVLFGDKPVVVDLVADNVRALVGKIVFVELGVDGVESWAETMELPGIYALPGGRHRIVGEIESQMEIGSGTVLYDLFIEPGPNYLAIDSNDIGGAVLIEGSRVAIDVTGLQLFPTGT